MNKPQSNETETQEDSNSPIPPITFKIPRRVHKSLDMPLENLKKEIPIRSNSRKTTQSTITADLFAARNSKISPTRTKKSLKPYKKPRNASQNLSKSFFETKKKVKLVKCDLKKGSFSDKQNVFVEKLSNTCKTSEKKSVSPIKKIRNLNIFQCFIGENNKRMQKENIEDRRKNWRMAMREIDNSE